MATDSPQITASNERRLRRGNRRRWRRARDQHGGETPGRRTSVDLRDRTAV